jgi:hypothetical protein
MKGADRFIPSQIHATCCCCGRKVQLLNISLGGYYVAAEVRPRIGESMSIEVDLGTQPPFRIYGQVAWINESAKPRAPELPPGYGVRIMQIDMVAKLALLNYLRRLEQVR